MHAVVRAKYSFIQNFTGNIKKWIRIRFFVSFYRRGARLCCNLFLDNFPCVLDIFRYFLCKILTTKYNISVLNALYYLTITILPCTLHGRARFSERLTASLYISSELLALLLNALAELFKTFPEISSIRK